MKIIHTADVHLDSPISGTSDPKQRRYELLRALREISDYADNNGVEAVIVAGDLFDGRSVSESTLKSVSDIINGSKADWFVLRGNHGDVSPYEKLLALSPKIKTFKSDWTFYNAGNVTVCGRELGERDEENWAKLALDDNRYNIIVIHGDIDDDSYGFIDKKAISSTNAKYVALGHRHCFSPLKFGRVKGCYCGTPEARGFDELEQTGFVLIDTEKDDVRFVPRSIRRVVSKEIDVSSVPSDIALERKIMDAAADVDSRNYLNLVFVGENSGLRIETAAKILDGRFFALRIDDRSVFKTDMKSLLQEVSLRGEFARLVVSSEESDEVKAAVLKLGLSAINGEELL